MGGHGLLLTLAGAGLGGSRGGRVAEGRGDGGARRRAGRRDAAARRDAGAGGRGAGGARARVAELGAVVRRLAVRDLEGVVARGQEALGRGPGDRVARDTACCDVGVISRLLLHKRCWGILLSIVATTFRSLESPVAIWIVTGPSAPAQVSLKGLPSPMPL